MFESASANICADCVDPTGLIQLSEVLMPANNKMFHTGLYFEARTQSFDANTAPFCLGVPVFRSIKITPQKIQGIQTMSLRL